jgi:4-hydroxymandelate synthase
MLAVMPRSRIPRVAFDFLELWVRDLDSTANILTTRFGFEREADVDQDAASFISGNVTVLVRQGTPAASPIARHVATHGDGVGDIALACDDVESLVERALAHGLKTSVDGESVRIDVLGDETILHTVRPQKAARPSDLGVLPMRGIDHVTYCLPFGTLEYVARVYRDVFGLENVEVEQGGDFGDDDNGMRSRVLRSPAGLTVVLTEPMSATGWGQTQHFLRSHAGAGVQHAAIAYDDLITAVETLRSRGVPFLSVPQEHLERSHQRLHDHALPWTELRHEGILVDADSAGLLFQLFTAPVTADSNFFFEVIQRAGATGFGAANIRGLFAALDVSTSQDRVKETA